MSTNLSSPSPSPSPRRRRWRRVLLAATGAVSLLALATVYTLWDMWHWSPFQYALACRRPLSELCANCPTLHDLDADGNGELDQAEAAGDSLPLRRCGLGMWYVATEGDAFTGIDKEMFFDRSGRLVATWEFGAGQPRSDTCRSPTDWYGPLVLCRVTQRFSPVPTVSLPPGAPPPETVVVRTVVFPVVWR